MTYGETVDLVENTVLAIGNNFYHYTSDHVNEYRGGFPLCVFFPPSANLQILNPDVMAAVASYDIRIAFLDLIKPNSERAEKQQVVEEQFQKAYNFVAQLMLNIDSAHYIETSRISTNPTIEPFFTFPWNSHLTAGVLLSFTYETTPTWDCSSLETQNEGLSNPLEFDLVN